MRLGTLVSSLAWILNSRIQISNWQPVQMSIVNCVKNWRALLRLATFLHFYQSSFNSFNFKWHPSKCLLVAKGWIWHMKSACLPLKLFRLLGFWGKFLGAAEKKGLGKIIHLFDISRTSEDENWNEMSAKVFLCPGPRSDSPRINKFFKIWTEKTSEGVERTRFTSLKIYSSGLSNDQAKNQIFKHLFLVDGLMNGHQPKIQYFEFSRLPIFF